MGNIPLKAGEKISKKMAKDLVDNFKSKVKIKNKSTYYSWDVFERLKNVPGCVGIRVYPGLENETFCPILVAVDAKGNNIYYDPSKVASLSEEDSSSSSIEERGAICPPYCPDNDL